MANAKATLRKLNVDGMSDAQVVSAVEQMLLARPKLAPLRGKVLPLLKSALTRSLPANKGRKEKEERKSGIRLVVGRRPKQITRRRPSALERQVRAAILKHEMLTAGDLLGILGSRTMDDRARVRVEIASLRRQGALVALRSGSRVLYPAFQVDRASRAIYPEVQRVNEILGAVDDPWGVASWWTSSHGRVEGAASPMSLLGTPRSGDLIAIAESLYDDSY